MAMYSSLAGGIITDPALMSVPIDEHMIVRGHSVFESSSVVNGQLFLADQHLNRLFESARLARIPLPFGDDLEANRTRIIQIAAQTVVATGMRNCEVRMYLSV